MHFAEKKTRLLPLWMQPKSTTTRPLEELPEVVIRSIVRVVINTTVVEKRVSLGAALLLSCRSFRLPLIGTNWDECRFCTMVMATNACEACDMCSGWSCVECNIKDSGRVECCQSMHDQADASRLCTECRNHTEWPRCVGCDDALCEHCEQLLPLRCVECCG